MKHAWTVLIALHAIAATYSLLFGAVNLLRKRKGDKPHRTLGFIWLACMYFVIISSFWIQTLRPGNFSWIHGLSVFTFITISIGLYAAATHNIKSHMMFMTGSYFGLIGALIGVIAVPSRLIPRLAMYESIRFASIAAAISLSAYFCVRATIYLGDDNSAKG